MQLQYGRRKRIFCKGSYRGNFFCEDSNDETFDCGYDLDIIPDSENEGDSESSGLDIQIVGLTLQESNKAESLTDNNCNKITL